METRSPRYLRPQHRTSECPPLPASRRLLANSAAALPLAFVMLYLRTWVSVGSKGKSGGGSVVSQFEIYSHRTSSE